MECAECRFVNRSDARFCGGCGARLPLALGCARCGEKNPATHKFCQACGTPLRAKGDAPASSANRPPEAVKSPPTSRPVAPSAPRDTCAVETAPAGERRQLTVLFCDLVGSTALSSRLDVEDLREVMTAYHDACAAVIERFEGHVAQYLGDGLLAYFGYPHAHDDDAARAVNAALAIPRAMIELEKRGDGRIASLAAHLAVRVGIHTGPVIVGGGSGRPTRESLAMGETINIAARLQALADPDTILITEATRRLVERLFELAPVGEQQLRGVNGAVLAHRVERTTGAASRLVIAATIGLTPFVGREQELALLLDRWAQAREGRGQAVLVSGDAGVGKSRLVQQLHKGLSGEDFTWIESRSSAYHRNTAFHPIVDLIERVIGIDPDDQNAARIDKLEDALTAAGLDANEVVPLAAPLLSVPVPERYAALELSAEARRRKTLEAIVEWFFALVSRGPLVFVMEDLGWVDPSSLELLDMLVAQVPTAPAFVVMTTRSDLELRWSQVAHVTNLRLNPLSGEQTLAMLGRVAGDARLPTDVIGQLVSKSDGVPLYVEELTKAVLEVDSVREVDVGGRHGYGHSHIAIPATLQDSLMARLDRLDTAKEVAQIASVLGREFPHELLACVSQIDGAALDHAMHALAKAELLYSRGVPPRATYTFKHALIRDTAYESLLRARRAELHARAARALEDRFPEVVAREPEVVAFHFAQARLFEPAAAYFQRAGERAKERLANFEAIGHLQRARDLLLQTPPSQKRDHAELRLQVALGAPLIATQGYAHEQVHNVFERARTLCDEIGDAPDLFEAVYGLSTYYMNRTEMERALELSERLVELAKRIPAPSRMPWAQQQMGCACYFGGDPVRARHHFEQAVATYDAKKHDALLHTFGQDPTVASLALGGMARWLVGEPDDAIVASRKAVERAREVAHAFSLAFAICFCGFNHVQRREREQARALAREAVTLCEEQSIHQWLGPARLLEGWAAEDPEEGLRIVQVGVGDAGRRLSLLGAPMTFGLLVDRQLDAGRIDDAIAACAHGLQVANETQNHFWDAELHRLRGDLELRRAGGTADEALVHYRRALLVARAQRARSLELRAAVSTARVLAEGGRREEARTLVAPIFESFAQGLETFDLRAASALLADVA